ncbi:hypothetical protein QCA50_008142 [Cerrena zonata]|uniref:Uncharacterized protein n=1 Tax=Cerrena zonata TaxID=2478898 RepID=A0AAW0GAE2_9APHY
MSTRHYGCWKNDMVSSNLLLFFQTYCFVRHPVSHPTSENIPLTSRSRPIKRMVLEPHTCQCEQRGLHVTFLVPSSIENRLLKGSNGYIWPDEDVFKNTPPHGCSLDVCFFASAFTWTIFHPDSPSCGWEHRLGLDTDIGGEMSPVDCRPGSRLSRFAERWCLLTIGKFTLAFINHELDADDLFTRRLISSRTPFTLPRSI